MPKSCKTFGNDIDKEYILINKKRYYYVLSDYPFHEQCIVSLLKKNSLAVPNFLGGPLLRNNQGSYEYYCLTMMTLFRPWQRGSERKQKVQSWESEFNKHKFS